MRTLIRTALLACVLATPAIAHDGIHVEDPYLLAAPAAKSAAAFMRIVNHSDQPDRLVSARSDVAEVLQTHTHTTTAEGVMQMRHVEEGFPVEGHAEHVLDRGGDHLMLMGLTRRLSPGETVTIELTFERGEVIEVEMPVTDKTPEGTTGGHHAH